MTARVVGGTKTSETACFSPEYRECIGLVERAGCLWWFDSVRSRVQFLDWLWKSAHEVIFEGPCWAADTPPHPHPLKSTASLYRPMHCILLKRCCWGVKKSPEGGLYSIRLPALQELTPGIANSPFISSAPPPRTTRSLLERIIRDVLYNDFIKFNVHSRLQGLGLPAQQELTLVKGIL